MQALETLSREELVALLHELMQRVADLEKENAELRAQLDKKGKSNTPPSFIKPNRKPRPEGDRLSRKKRMNNFARKREQPTEVVFHSLEHCPDCGRKLAGGWEHTRRQVIEIPESPVRIIDHVLIARRCGICEKIHYASVGPADGVLGQHRVGIRLMSLIALLATECRMPQERIRGLLESLYGVHLALGEISEILHTVAKQGEEIATSIHEEIRQAPVVHGDETGWREDGTNGYLWSFSTPTARYFYRDRSRSGQVARDILGEGFTGVLVTDFYSGYSWYTGPAQRCWVHFYRDLKALKEEYQNDPSVIAWVDSILNTYRRAKAIADGKHTEEERWRYRCAFEQELLALAQPYLADRKAPQYTLADRIRRFQSQLFTFVQYAGVPSENNAAERAVRPAVTSRKVSGGTRSARGSQTKATLLTLFGTWKIRGLERLQACIQMLTNIPIATCAAHA